MAHGLGITIELADTLLTVGGQGEGTVGWTEFGGYRRGYAVRQQRGRPDSWDFVSWITSHGEGTNEDRRGKIVLNDDEPFLGSRGEAVVALQRRLLQLALLRYEKDLERDKIHRLLTSEEGSDGH